MKKVLFVTLVVSMCAVGAQGGIVLQDEYTPPHGWYWLEGGNPGTLLQGTTAVKSGTYSLEVTDGVGFNAVAATWLGNINASSLSTGALEVQFKNGWDYVAGAQGLTSVHIGLGNSSSDYEAWGIHESRLEGTADENGWYTAQLELDASSQSTLTGSNINGIPLSAASGDQVYRTGTVDWTVLNWLTIGIYQEGWFTDSRTYYFDKSELIPEPMTILLLGGGLLGMLRRRR